MADSLRDRIESVAEATIKRGTDCDAGPQCPKCLAIHVADAVIRELKIAKACEGGCVWQIPNHVEDMTQAQRELLGMMTDPAQKIADSTRRDHLGPFTDPEKFAE